MAGTLARKVGEALPFQHSLVQQWQAQNDWLDDPAQTGQ
jgi:hypothetical protein